MKRIVLLAALLGALLAACTGGSPDLILDQATMDLGEVVNGEVRRIEIPLRNGGEGDLIIEAVTTSCGCTTAEVSPTTIPAGEGGTLTIEFDSGAHGPEEVGPVLRQIFIASNDVDEPEIEFRFTADVIAGDS